MLMLVAFLRIVDVPRLIAVVFVIVALVGVVNVATGFRFAHADYLPTQFPGPNPEFHCASGPGSIQWAAPPPQAAGANTPQPKAAELPGRTAQITGLG